MNSIFMAEPGHNYNVPKSLRIPLGATHYESCMVYKFYKIEGDLRWVWRDDKWHEIKKNARYGWFPASPSKIELLNIPSNPKTIETIYGAGIILEGGLVDLENNPFSYRPVSLFQSDILREARE